MSTAFPLRVKAVMIDLDGTLADTIPDLAAGTNMMLRELGRPVLEVEQIRNFVGKGIPRLVERALAGSVEGTAPADEMARALPIFERCYAEVNGRHSVLYPGVHEALLAMRSMQLPLACVTISTRSLPGTRCRRKNPIRRSSSTPAGPSVLRRARC